MKVVLSIIMSKKADFIAKVYEKALSSVTQNIFQKNLAGIEKHKKT